MKPGGTPFSAPSRALCAKVHRRVERDRCLQAETRRRLLTAQSSVVYSVDALAYLHRNQTAHRDLKPANLLLVGDAAPPRKK